MALRRAFSSQCSCPLEYVRMDTTSALRSPMGSSPVYTLGEGWVLHFCDCHHVLTLSRLYVANAHRPGEVPYKSLSPWHVQPQSAHTEYPFFGGGAAGAVSDAGVTDTPAALEEGRVLHFCDIHHVLTRLSLPACAHRPGEMPYKSLSPWHVQPQLTHTGSCPPGFAGGVASDAGMTDTSAVVARRERYTLFSANTILSAFNGAAFRAPPMNATAINTRAPPHNVNKIANDRAPFGTVAAPVAGGACGTTRHECSVEPKLTPSA